ncbi:RNA polymerase sigma-70 factor, ECF subfamily [Chitinophaga sp. YR573]|uniref:RNA polymerase sigma factor n=1 Tax=Chitinophaga sp. YR573 TaxID=1881040 RepID=UPI0008D65C64|nr:sigma-70 family RNA polymerase sigma factor [Chitinophaga sp. YR573]SEW21322.1 RNA polymerase sigma-70 factor, ECF subfamily [Chitinophaga sp. YR573]
MSEDNDQILLTRLRLGDESAFKEIYSKYFGNLVFEAFHHLRDISAAKDVVQDLFTNLWATRHLHNLSGKDKEDVKLKAYLKVSVRYSCGKIAIKKQKERGSMVQYVNESLYQNDGQDAKAQELEEIDNQIRSFINELPAKRREIVIDVYLQEVKIKEVARKNGITTGTVRNSLHRGLETIRQKFAGKINPHGTI